MKTRTILVASTDCVVLFYSMLEMIQPVRRSYRELVRLIHRLSRSERDAALVKAHEEMTRHANACDEEVADLHRTLVSKICFLRMKVPKQARDASAVGVGHFVVREGKVVEGRGQILEQRYAIFT